MNEEPSNPVPSPATPEIVPLHKANIQKDKVHRLINGIGIDLPGDRKVLLFDIVDGAYDGGLCVRIFRPTDDGKVACLEFGLAEDAADALLQLLHTRKVNKLA